LLIFTGGRRGSITLNHILKFATGAEDEPVLGFVLKPSIEFVEVASSFIPTANTCINLMKLPRPTPSTPVLPDNELFSLYDYAFSNSYYGMV